MKLFTSILILCIGIPVFSQNSEDLVPKDALSVFSINNVNLLQKISLDELVKYEFMEEVQQELFDGSTSGKTLKDSGIDFDQKLNVFFGKGVNFELSGFTFGVTDRSQLFEVFDDFHPEESDYKGVDFYVSYFNRIAIKNNIGILFRVSPNMSRVNTITDSIWYARGNEYPWYNDDLQDLINSLEELDTTTVSDDGVEFTDEMEIEQNTPTPSVSDQLPVADENPNTKTYYELRDSVELELQNEYLKYVCDGLFINEENLVKSSEEFRKQLTHESEGVFYMDNSKTISEERGFMYMKSLYPRLYTNIQDLYEGNILLGDLLINDNSIELKIDAKYGDKLGSIYQKMTDAKFDKNVLKYIHEENSSFFTYRVNLREAYEQTYDVIVPLLEDESNQTISAQLLMIELLDEFLNKDAIFNTYKGSMFGTYNGIKKVKTKKIIYEYDEETFEYLEEEVEAEEDMPIFTFGLSTDRPDIPEKILKRMTKITDKCRKENEYWVIDNAVLRSAPLYMINKNGLFIFTNDEDLAKYNSNGYGSNSIGSEFAKKAKSSGFMYGYADLGKAIENLPKEFFNDDENELLDVIRGKTGTIEFTSSKANINDASFNLMYNFEGEYDASGTYILDLINSFYVVSK